MKKKEAFYPLLKSTTPIVCPDFEISTCYYYDLSVQTHQTTSNCSKDCFLVSFTGGNQTQDPMHAKHSTTDLLFQPKIIFFKLRFPAQEIILEPSCFRRCD